MKTVNYLWLAEHAAELERSGNFKEAAFQWTCASQQVASPKNLHWAESRADFCNEQLRRNTATVPRGVPCH